MANPNIFQQYLQPPRSVMDYGADMDKAESNRLALIGQRRQNELAGIGIEQQRAAAQLGAAKQNALQAIANDPAMADPVARETAMLNHPLLSAEGQAMRQSRLAAGKTEAETADKKAEAARKDWDAKNAQREAALRAISAFQSPQDAFADLMAKKKSGELAPDVADRVAQSIPQDPAAFPKWQLSTIRALMSAKDQEEARQADLKRTAPVPTEVKLGNRVAFIDTNPNSPTFKQEVTQAKIGQSPDNAATLARQAADAAAGRAVTMRGQDMTNERAKEAAVAAAGGANKPLNDSQSKALLFGSRMREADKLLSELSAKGVDMPSLTKQAADSVPFVGGALGALANAGQNPDQQSVEQAQRDFVNAVLRRESGAAISPGEFDSARKQYFPAIGDSKQVKEQKARNRQLAIDGLLAEVPEGKRDSIRPMQAPTAGAPPMVTPGGWSITPVK